MESITFWLENLNRNQVLLVAVVLVIVLLAQHFIRLRNVPFLRPFRTFLIWSFALLFILSNLGFDVTSLVAGLGVGGVAIALGLQTTLESLFSSLTIITEKTFHVGETIKLSGYEEGKVLKIGFRSTTLETSAKRILIIPNKLLITGVIDKKK